MGTISLLSNPLFSTIVTLYLLILLYLPLSFLRLFLPPLLISTSILLSLLRLGTSQQLQPKPPNGPSRSEPEPDLPIPEPNLNQVGTRPEVEPEPEAVTEIERCEFTNQEVRPDPGPEIDPNLFCKESFVGWDVGAPLGVIYEAYEGEEGRHEDQNVAFRSDYTSRLERYPSLSRYYPESESESESDTECSSSLSLSWEGEFLEREELIEIALDYYGDNQKGTLKKKKIVEEVKVEYESYDDDEDNLIEIDISPTTSNSGFCW